MGIEAGRGLCADVGPDEHDPFTNSPVQIVDSAVGGYLKQASCPTIQPPCHDLHDVALETPLDKIDIVIESIFFVGKPQSYDI